MKEVVILGGGLTGLTIAYLLKKKGIEVLVLEQAGRVGGAIKTHIEGEYVFEEGPNTGVISTPEVADLFEMLQLKPEIANESAEKRLILKNGNWYSLPSGFLSFMKTPLFTLSDKFKILFEPLRLKGKNSQESIASLAKRRIGQSFVDYAVNPFISGIYAGDPKRLVTKYALPKLYRLEQEYGSFLGGAFKKSFEKKTERDKKATRKVFSMYGGLEQLVDSLRMQIGDENIVVDAKNARVSQQNGMYNIEYSINGQLFNTNAKTVVSTIGSQTLSATFPFLQKADLADITNINYAKVIQVAVALKKDALKPKYTSFGGLIPQKEKRNLLGILFPSYCFEKRAPKDCSMLAIYLGGIKRPDLFEFSDQQIRNLVCHELEGLLNLETQDIVFMKIFRHRFAIPQYERSTRERLDAIRKIEHENPRLILAGNIRDGIGISDRIRQAFDVSEQITKDRL